MIQHIAAKKRHFKNLGWLKTYWLFSFSDYYDEDNVSHGSLRVFNDDIVQPHTGFGKHPHREMEIISVVLSGEMEHKDDMGNTQTVCAGDVQRMTAGTGIMHSEWNNANKPVAFLQIWILPDKAGLTPSYDQKNFDTLLWQNKIKLLASGNPAPDTVRLNTDAHLYRAKISNETHLKFATKDNRDLFIYTIEGEVEVNGQLSSTRDQLRISNEQHLLLSTPTQGDCLILDVRPTHGE